MTEKEFTRTVLDTARRLGYRCAHFRSVPIQRKSGAVYYATPVQGDEGFPDVVLAKEGRLYFLELKVGKNKPTPAQEEWLRHLNITSSLAMVIRPDDYDDLVEVLR